RFRAEEIGKDEVDLEIFRAAVEVTLGREGKAQRDVFQFLGHENLAAVSVRVVLKIRFVFITGAARPFVREHEREGSEDLEIVDIGRTSFGTKRLIVFNGRTEGKR